MGPVQTNGGEPRARSASLSTAYRQWLAAFDRAGADPVACLLGGREDRRALTWLRVLLGCASRCADPVVWPGIPAEAIHCGNLGWNCSPGFSPTEPFYKEFDVK